MRSQRERCLGYVLIHLGVPPALPGGPKSLTIPGVWTGNAISETPNRELPSTRKGGFSMDEHKNLSHPKWMGKFDVVSSQLQKDNIARVVMTVFE